MDDVQAIRRLKGGDIGGLEALVTRYQVKAVETAFLITQDEALAEDVAQEVFVRIFQRIRRFDESRPFQPYLVRSVVNAALNAVQKGARWARPAASGDASEQEALLSQAASVEDQVELAQLRRKVSAALSRLPPRQRAAVVQRYYLEMSEKEMSEAMDAAPGTIKWLLHAARARLRALLGSERSAE
jgi:RNA polymerase sigma-70 factor (ECF subfamily)